MKKDFYATTLCLRPKVCRLRKGMVIIMKKNRLIIVLVCCTLLYMTGCGHSKDAERNVLRVGVVLYTQDDPFINALTECLRDELKKYESDSFKIIMTVRYGKNDQNIQDEVVGEILDAGCDILAVDLVDIMQWDKLYYVGGDARQSGIMQGEIVSEVIHADQELDRNGDGKIQYVLLEGEAGHQDAIIRTDSVVRTIQSQGIYLEKLSYQFANWNRSQAENKMLQLIHQYGDDIELVLCNNDEMAMGAVDAYEDEGYSLEERPAFFGIDGLDGTLEAVKNDIIQGTVFNDRQGQAEQIARLATDLFKGNALSGYDFVNERYIFLPYQKVTISNVDTFMNR